MDRKAQQEKLGISWWSPGETSLQRQTSDNPRLWRCQRLYAVSFRTCWPLQARNPVLHGGLLLTWTKYSFQYFMQGSLPPFTEVWLTFGTVLTCTNTFFLKDKTICIIVPISIAITAIKGGHELFSCRTIAAHADCYSAIWGGSAFSRILFGFSKSARKREKSLNDSFVSNLWQCC